MQAANSSTAFSGTQPLNRRQSLNDLNDWNCWNAWNSYFRGNRDLGCQNGKNAVTLSVTSLQPATCRNAVTSLRIRKIISSLSRS